MGRILELQAPVAEPDEPYEPPRRGRGLRWLAAFVALAMVLTAGATAIRLILFGAPVRGEGWVSAGALSDIRAAGVVEIGSAEAFVVARPDGLVALSSVSPHLGHPLSYCASSGWFEGAHGELFDGDGTYADGPSPRGMDRLQVREADGEIFVRAFPVIEGPPRGTGAVDRPLGPFCFRAVV